MLIKILMQYLQLYDIEEWIVDLKLQSINYKSDYYEILMRNLEILRSYKSNIIFRLLYVESIKINDVISILKRMRITVIEVIKCHSLAKSKYLRFGLEYIDYTPSEKSYNQFIYNLCSNGIKVNELHL
jgi:pyruvate formate lyase activating enzyme